VVDSTDYEYLQAKQSQSVSGANIPREHIQSKSTEWQSSKGTCKDTTFLGMGLVSSITKYERPRQTFGKLNGIK